MPVFDLFSKKQKRLRGETPDVYSYDNFPQPLKVQIVHIIKDAVGEDISYSHSDDEPSKVYKSIHKILCREYGIFSLSNSEYSTDSDQKCIFTFFLRTIDMDKIIDIIQLSFQHIDRGIRKDINYRYKVQVSISPDEAIEELNQRFKEHGIGYQFDGGEIIRVDSTYIHSEIVKPTIKLLWNKKFIGANEEFLKAHEHYRHGRNKECLNDSLKAFESTLKIICKEKGWLFKETDTAKKLIQICFQNELVPSFSQNQFTSLQNLLESGIATIRNKLGGHGQGQVPQKVDDGMTRFGLNLTGTCMIFLIEQSGIQ